MSFMSVKQTQFWTFANIYSSCCFRRPLTPVCSGGTCKCSGLRCLNRCLGGPLGEALDSAGVSGATQSSAARRSCGVLSPPWRFSRRRGKYRTRTAGSRVVFGSRWGQPLSAEKFIHEASCGPPESCRVQTWAGPRSEGGPGLQQKQLKLQKHLEPQLLNKSKLAKEVKKKIH